MAIEDGISSLINIVESVKTLEARLTLLELSMHNMIETLNNITDYLKENK